MGYISVVKDEKTYWKIQFPLTITCRRIENKYGISYGREKDFCGKEFQANACDIRKRTWKGFWIDRTGIDYGVVCPCCQNFIPIDENLLPEDVKKEII